ncbi:tryptase beta-2-like isoform X1 [Diorhabda carinulata]|uniref:tryptase beta-2-like isoform X1 n=2 Tax=Diorhabda carinulata TaxID=1163345 RepID=UPI0025A29C51|nr:tryptase beta-2-like isoform X1 [Diorhabda carinulata]
MYWNKILLVLLEYNFVGFAIGQATSGVLNGQYYLCLPVETICPTNSGAGTIDPRIVTPTSSSVCPNGTIPCFGTNTACGTPFITSNMAGPGNTSFGAYPWQAYLRNTTNVFAGSGVLISPYYVITAAHKVYLNMNTPTAVTVLMGVWDPSNLVNVQSSTVARISVHPTFVASTLIDDIAVLQLTQPIVLGIFNNINTICLSTTGTSYVGQSCVVSGWGQTAFTIFDAPTTPQKQVFVTITDYTTCRASFAMANLLGTNVDTYLDPNGEICAGGQSMLDACTQDGGSPLVCPSSTGTYSVAGLVIWGKNCGLTGVYGVYVNVPYYYDWIVSQMTTT